MSQRDYAKNYFETKYNPTKNDLLIVTDLDEILTREGIECIISFIKLEFYSYREDKKRKYLVILI